MPFDNPQLTEFCNNVLRQLADRPIGSGVMAAAKKPSLFSPVVLRSAR